MKPIAIYGAGGLGREMQILLAQIKAHSPQWELIGFFDDAGIRGDSLHGLKHLGGIRELENWPDELNLVLAFGNPKHKEKVVNTLGNGRIQYPSLIHPTVQIADFQNIQISDGVIIAAGCTLTADVLLGPHVFLNLHCTVGHNTVIGPFSSLMPGCHVSGGVQLSRGVYVGTGSVLINEVQIGEGALIGAGSVVNRDVPAGGRVAGVPAKPIKSPAKR